MNAVGLQLRHKIIPTVAPVIRRIITLVMISEHIVNAIGGLHLPKRLTAADHILLRGIIVHKIPCHQKDIWILLLDFL